MVVSGKIGMGTQCYHGPFFMGMGGNGNDFVGMGGNGNGNDFTGIGGNGNSRSHSRTPLLAISPPCRGQCDQLAGYCSD